MICGRAVSSGRCTKLGLTCTALGLASVMVYDVGFGIKFASESIRGGVGSFDTTQSARTQPGSWMCGIAPRPSEGTGNVVLSAGY